MFIDVENLKTTQKCRSVCVYVSHTYASVGLGNILSMTSNQHYALSFSLAESFSSKLQLMTNYLVLYDYFLLDFLFQIWLTSKTGIFLMKDYTSL